MPVRNYWTLHCDFVYCIGGKLSVIRSGRLYWLISAAFLLWALPAGAEQFSMTSETIFRAFQLDRRDRNKADAAPVYEYLKASYTSQKAPGLSMHLGGWGRLNLADNYTYQADTTNGQLLYTYLQYAPPKQAYQLRVGRQYIFEGVARDNLDGIYGKFLVLPRTNLALYAGVPTTLDKLNGRKDDLLYGGKLTYSQSQTFDAGISYKRTLDSGATREHLLGGDLAVTLPRKITLLGHATYDLVSNGLGEQSYEMRLPVGPLSFHPFFQRFRYKSYFSSDRSSVPPFRFLENSDNVVTTAGSDIFWYPSDRGEVMLRFKNYDYKERFKPSQYYSLIANRRWKILNEAGVEFGRMQGSEAANRYLLSRAYAYWTFTPVFVTGDLTYVHYDQAIYGKSSSMFASVGFGTGFLKDTLNVKISFDYSSDPYFKSDYRVMGKVNYMLDKNFDLPWLKNKR